MMEFFVGIDVKKKWRFFFLKKAVKSVCVNVLLKLKIT